MNIKSKKEIKREFTAINNVSAKMETSHSSYTEKK
jgi:hypothetical protein